MSSAPASASPFAPADLLPGCPELQVPSGTISLAEANLYRMMDLLASSDILSFDLHLKYIERIAAVQEKLLAMRKAIFQLDCAAADQAANDAAASAAAAPATPSATDQSANSTAAIAAVEASDSPDQSPALNQPSISLGRIAPIPDIPPLAPLAPLSSGLAHSKPETSSSAISSTMATPAVAATPATPATPACSVNQILDQLSQAIAAIDQLSSEIQGNLEKAAPATEQVPVPIDPPASTIAHQSSTPTNNHTMPFANPPAPRPISDA